MGKASRAIIIENNKILVMRRNKQGSQYFTLVGGKLNDHETPEQALVRELKEETGLDVIAARLVFFEEHPEPYNEQYIYLCNIAPRDNVEIQSTSEEALLNRLQTNLHEPLWVDLQSFTKLPFRTPQLQEAIVQCFKNGFPEKAVRL